MQEQELLYEALKKKIFPEGDERFENVALELFFYQYRFNELYRSFCDSLKKTPSNVNDITGIPFLPVEFFKTHEVLTGAKTAGIIFRSSGTTGQVQSRHLVSDVSLYEKSFRKAFELFYGDVQSYCILALLPSYLERGDSSLVYMADDLVKHTGNRDSGFYLQDTAELGDKLEAMDSKGQKVILLGVTYALLDMMEKRTFKLRNTIVMETGGMKGRRREMIREELHAILCKGFGVDTIHSEYGMTELLSQAYSKGKGLFRCPPWMRMLVRDPEDPMQFMENERTGGINVIDLANINSCAFIATQDLGRAHDDGSFEVLGRFDNSDIRGCNLMVG